MQKLAIVAGAALLVLAVMIGVALRRHDSERANELNGPANLGQYSMTAGAAESRHSPKSSRARSTRDPAPPIYSGPAGLEGWVQAPAPVEGTDPPWQFADGKLLSKRGGGIAREIPTPSRSKLSFQLDWRSSLRFRMLLSSAKGDTTQPDNAYDLVMQRRFVYLRKRWMTVESGGSRILGQANLAALAENEEALFEFYLDRESGLVAIYLNGERAHHWTDADPGVGLFGDWLHFISEDFYPVEISQLSVEAWDGRFPDGFTVEEFAEAEAARAQWIQSLKPVAPWAPEVEHRAAANLLSGLQRQAARTNDLDDEVVNEAAQALDDATRRLKQAHSELPVAETDPQRPGHVINPYTGQSLDRRGVRSGTRIRDPNDPDGERTFLVP